MSTRVVHERVDALFFQVAFLYSVLTLMVACINEHLSRYNACHKFNFSYLCVAPPTWCGVDDFHATRLFLPSSIFELFDFELRLNSVRARSGLSLALLEICLCCFWCVLMCDSFRRPPDVPMSECKRSFFLLRAFSSEVTDTVRHSSDPRAPCTLFDI